MNKNYHIAICAALVIVPLLSLSGCEIPAFKYERTMQLSAPLSAGSAFGAETHNGAITVNGRDAEGCELTATITARASTEEKAKELAEKTKVTLEPSANKLTVKINKPKLTLSQSIGVSLDAKVPKETNPYLVTHNGSVTVSDIKGKLDATTHNGTIKTSRVSGQSKLNTYNGAVVCEEVTGNAWMKTHNGSIKTYYSADAPPECEISLVTYNGSIELKTPPNLSAKVDLSTYNGKINTALPITIIGTVNKNKLQGTIGEGAGKLQLSTHNGSIKVR
jgi:DUF4097 and DUF4098 domain-containing protein YvlB